VRVLKAAVIIMGILLVVGSAVLVGGIFYKLSKAPAPPVLPPAAATLAPAISPPVTAVPGKAWAAAATLPRGAEIVESRADSGRLILRLKRADGAQEVWLFDAGTGIEIGRLTLAPATP